MAKKFGEGKAWSFRTRNETARWYADIIRYHQDADVSELNAGIVKRWSKSALDYIKKRAWKIAGEPL